MSHLEEDLIYHYCSVETLYAIINNKKLWLSDSLYMNDKYEIIWMSNIVVKVIDELLADFNVEQEKVTRLRDFKQTYEKFEVKKHYFVSFSSDGDLLSQWRGYGDDAKGVSICFEIKNLDEKTHFCGQISGVERIITPDKELGYERIDYNIEESVKRNILQLLDDTNISEELMSTILEESATASKHHSFYEEQEVRITYTPKDVPCKYENLSDKKFRERNKELIPYYEFDFTLNDSLVLRQIILGSKCKLDKNILQDFLKSNGFEGVEISLSESSYR